MTNALKNSLVNTLESGYNVSGITSALNNITDAANRAKEYNALLSQYQDYYSQINYLTNKKMPDKPESTNWTEYGLVPLKEQLSAYEQRQAVMMKSGWGNTDSPYYLSSYLPVYTTIQEINAQIKDIESELEKNSFYW